LDRLYLNGYIGPLATAGGLVAFMREQLDKPIPSAVVLGQVTEKFRKAVKEMAENLIIDTVAESGYFPPTEPELSASIALPMVKLPGFWRGGNCTKL